MHANTHPQNLLDLLHNMALGHSAEGRPLHVDIEAANVAYRELKDRIHDWLKLEAEIPVLQKRIAEMERRVGIYQYFFERLGGLES